MQLQSRENLRQSLISLTFLELSGTGALPYAISSRNITSDADLVLQITVWPGPTSKKLNLLSNDGAKRYRLLHLEIMYRVSHSKEWKVILLWWGHIFWFLLCVYVKIERKKNEKKSLNVPNVKLLSNYFFLTFLSSLCLLGGNDSLLFIYY